MWLSFDEVIQLGRTDRWIRQQAQSQTIRLRDTGRRSANGKAIREIELASLPEELQLKWLQQNRPCESESENIESSLTTNCIDLETRLTESLMRYEKPLRDALQKEALRLREIVERYLAIEPKRIKNAQTGKHDYVAEVYALCREAICKDVEILKIEPKRGKPISPFTLDTWARKIETEGLLTFIRKPPKPSGKTDNRLAEFSPEAMLWAEKQFRRFPSPGKLHDKLKKEAAKNDWIIPSKTYFYRRYEDIPKVVEAQIFGTSKHYQSKYAPYVPRDYSDLDALQVLCGDHSVRDVSVVMPDGNLARVWLTLWMCMRTYLIWGWHLDLIPSSRTIGLAYANGCKTFGAQPISRPSSGFYSYVYTDWGKDYRCIDFTGKTLTFTNAAMIEGGMQIITTQRNVGLLQELDVKHLLSRPYNAKEKPIERIHRDISQWEQNTFPEEYCGNDKNKPERWTANWHRHKKLQKKFSKNIPLLIQESPFMDFGSYRENLEGWITEHNSTGHKRTVLGGRTIIPIEELNMMYSRVHISEEAMAFLLLKSETKKILKNGITLTIEGQQLQFLHSEMSEHKDQYVEIRYTNNDFSHIWAILPATPEKPQRIVKADLINRSGLLNPNKETLAKIAKQANHERNLQRDFTLLNHSLMRGETVIDRVAQKEEIEIEDIQEMRQTGTYGNVHRMTRYDAPKIISDNQQVSAEQVESAEIIDIFRNKKHDTGKIKDEWED